ncbi:sulfite exporter TauE/SafE family protein, partial [Methylobacterium tarhaniae]
MTDLLSGAAGPLGWAVILATFLVAGFVKGVVGLGLPTVAVGLLATVMSPAQAAALLIVPSFVTNIWQLLVGPRFGALVLRLWPMMVAIAAGTVASAGLIAGAKGPGPASALGIALVAYAGIGLAGLSLRVPARAEPWLSPLVGLLTGLVTGATGVFVIPAVPYLQALGLDRDQLIQALGLSFTVSTVALAAGLA